MPEQQADAVIEQLKRANRRWKRLALGLLAAFVVAVAALAAFSAVQVNRARAAAEDARIQAEHARREVERAEQKERRAAEAAEWARKRAEQGLDGQ
jgi:hypothetical protein